MNFFYQLDVWESMLPFFEMGGMGKGKGVGTGRGVCGMGRGMNEWVGGWVEQKKLAEFPAKKFPVWFLAISQLLLGQIKKVRSVLKSAHSEEFKTVHTFVIWPSRSLDI